MPEEEGQSVPSWLQTFMADISGTREWSHSERIKLVNRLGFFCYYRPSDARAAAEQVRKILGISVNRFDALRKLDQTVEISRALHYDNEPTREHARLRDEEHLPRTGWLGEYLLHTQETECPLGWHFWIKFKRVPMNLMRRIRRL